jgi:hypothetical protein
MDIFEAEKQGIPWCVQCERIGTTDIGLDWCSDARLRCAACRGVTTKENRMTEQENGGTPPENDPEAAEDARRDDEVQTEADLPEGESAEDAPVEATRQGPEDPNPEEVADPDADEGDEDEGEEVDGEAVSDDEIAGESDDDGSDDEPAAA